MKSEHLIIIKYNQETNETSICIDMAVKELDDIAQIDMYKNAIDCLTIDYNQLMDKVYKSKPRHYMGGMFSAS